MVKRIKLDFLERYLVSFGVLSGLLVYLIIFHRNEVLFSHLAFFITTVSFTLLLGYQFTHEIRKTSVSFSNVLREIAMGNYKVRLDTDVIKSRSYRELSNNINDMVCEIEKVEEIRKNFIANISHDFRSPLTSIRGFVQALLDGTIPAESQEKYLKIVLAESERLTKMTEDILLLSKMESNMIKPDWLVFDIHDTLRRVLLQFEHNMIKKNLNLNLIASKKELYVEADSAQIQRVLYNIIDNAVKFTDNGGDITIETNVVGQKVEIKISDNGPGISEENIKYIWDRFSKVDRSRGLDKKGIGIGLSIVREIIRAHHEDIEVYSQLGKGTTFVFTLPYADYKSEGVPPSING